MVQKEKSWLFSFILCSKTATAVVYLHYQRLFFEIIHQNWTPLKNSLTQNRCIEMFARNVSPEAAANFNKMNKIRPIWICYFDSEFLVYSFWYDHIIFFIFYDLSNQVSNSKKCAVPKITEKFKLVVARPFIIMHGTIDKNENNSK